MMAVGVDPGRDLGGVEAEEVSPLDEGDAPLVDEATDVTDLDAEGVGDFCDGQQPAEELRVIGRWHAFLLCSE
jgi:hypothetical protein